MSPKRIATRLVTTGDTSAYMLSLQYSTTTTADLKYW